MNTQNRNETDHQNLPPEAPGNPATNNDIIPPWQPIPAPTGVAAPAFPVRSEPGPGGGQPPTHLPVVLPLASETVVHPLIQVQVDPAPMTPAPMAPSSPGEPSNRPAARVVDQPASMQHTVAPPAWPSQARNPIPDGPRERTRPYESAREVGRNLAAPERAEGQPSGAKASPARQDEEAGDRPSPGAAALPPHAQTTEKFQAVHAALAHHTAVTHQLLQAMVRTLQTSTQLHLGHQGEIQRLGEQLRVLQAQGREGGVNRQ